MRTCCVVDLAVLVDCSMNIRERVKRQVLGPCLRTKKKLRNMRVATVSIVIGSLKTVPQKLEKRNVRVGNRKKNQDHAEKLFAKNEQNTKKSPGGLRRLTVTQIMVKRIRTIRPQ